MNMDALAPSNRWVVSLALLLEIELLVLLAVIVLIILGVIILMVIVRGVIHWLPAVVAAVLVYLISGSLLWAAGAFLVVAILMIAFRRR